KRRAVKASALEEALELGLELVDRQPAPRVVPGRFGRDLVLEIGGAEPARGRDPRSGVRQALHVERLVELEAGVVPDRPAHRPLDASALAEVEHDLAADRQRLAAL